MKPHSLLVVCTWLMVASLCAADAPKLESWADPALPVKSDLMVWLDAAAQPSAYTAHWRLDDAGGEVVDVCYDGSGNERDFVQPIKAMQPRLITDGQASAIRFDGEDDHLRWSGRAGELSALTIFVVAAPRANAGYFPGLLAGYETGFNDYTHGFNLDLGPQPSKDNIPFLNFETKGAGGARNLLRSPLEFATFETFALTSSAGKAGVKLYVNGELTGERDRDPGSIKLHSLTLGARYFSNEGVPPFIRSFFAGDIAEVLVYSRVLADDERKLVEAYLAKKHSQLTERIAAVTRTGKILQKVANPPAVQMFMPGFSARKLPLELTNINNVRYRDDGKLVASSYDGKIYLLSDTNSDGLEDHADVFYDSKGGIVAPIGMALTPKDYKLGRGAFVAAKGKLALIVDTNGDDKADKEIVVASGWPGTFTQVDALGVAIGPDQSIYFGIGCANFIDPYQRDPQGVSHYDVKSERGTILKVSPDFSHREIVCTGIRFPVGLAFNPLGDLFATDQEGATWCPNGNPFDELLHIQPGRHYGFPPRHPKYLPNVIDEPSTFDYGPQHQSTCGLIFDEPVNGGPIFGPLFWRGSAIICGESRGKLYRTQLAKTPNGYVAQNQIIGSLPSLLIDSCVSPHGDLVLTTHSGNPDWGSGPTGRGMLYKIHFAKPDAPQPLLCWTSGPDELRIAFDRPLDPAALKGIAKSIAIECGRYVGAGDRFETMQPGYAQVKRQGRAPRFDLAVTGAQLASDGRTLVINTSSLADNVNRAITITGLNHTKPAGEEIAQVDAIDLACAPTGVSVDWKANGASEAFRGWIPHPDLAASREFTTASSEHERLWQLLAKPGTLRLRTKIDLSNMLRPMSQPGSFLDYTLPPEEVTVSFESNVELTLKAGAAEVKASKTGDRFVRAFTVTPKENEPWPVEIELPTGESSPALSVSFTTNEDTRERPLALRRFILPWAKQPTDSLSRTTTLADIPELKGGDWLRGRKVFFCNQAACYKCHAIRGEGSDLGPDLSNLVHRDYDSVLRDINNPSGAINPDYLASIVKLKDGRVLSGIVRNVDANHILVRGDLEGEKSPIARADIAKISPSTLSLMPEGIAKGIGRDNLRDLMTFLLTHALEPAPLERDGAPPPRTRAEVDAILKAAPTLQATTQPTSSRPLNIILVSGPKDHGPGEHDYPLWQKRWSKLLALSENVNVTTADAWPSAEQWSTANVVVFYSDNPAWNASRGPELDAYLARGGGLVYLHFAVDGHDAVPELAERIGLAWRGGSSTFRHGQQSLKFPDPNDPITRGFKDVTFTDESYWSLTGDPQRIHTLSTGDEQGQPRPLLWTIEHGRGRVFVSILGHYTWTFDDPLFRILILRGMSWAGHEPVDRLTPLSTIGARLTE
jgi:putative heme-binding domain-containing protein